jgi:hypothetical protein
VKDWEPKPSERVYYRSKHDGQRAYLVKRNGVDMLRLDRPMEELLVDMAKDGGGWEKDSQSYPVSAHQAAKIAFVADRALCAVLGERFEAREDWINLHEKERIRFMEDGPDVDGPRDTLFLAIMGALKELTGG